MSAVLVPSSRQNPSSRPSTCDPARVQIRPCWSQAAIGAEYETPERPAGTANAAVLAAEK